MFSLLSQADFKKEELAKDKKKGKKKWSKQDWIDPGLKIMGGRMWSLKNNAKQDNL